MDLEKKNCTEEDINQTSYICFDENGNWSRKNDFSNEWGKFLFYILSHQFFDYFLYSSYFYQISI